MSEVISARQSILNYVTGEVLGSVKPHGEDSVPLHDPLDGTEIQIAKEHRNSAHHDTSNGLRIIRGTEPRFVFGTGILHPPRTEAVSDDEDGGASGVIEEEGKELGRPPEFEISQAKLTGDNDSEPFGLERSQNQRPSAMGLSATVESAGTTVVTFEISATTYSHFDVTFEGESYSQTWWRPIRHTEKISVDFSSLTKDIGVVTSHKIPGDLGSSASLQTRISRRGNKDDSQNHMLTAVVKHDGKTNVPLYQFELEIQLTDGRFVSSSREERWVDLDNEEQEIEFLYRHASAFAVGHGVSANWDDPGLDGVKKIFTESIPVFHSEVLETALSGDSGVNDALQMSFLASAQPDELRAAIQLFIDNYSDWIQEQTALANGLSPTSQIISGRLANKAGHILSRMQSGLDTLLDGQHPEVLMAFRLANSAMLLQQQRGKVQLRPFEDSTGAPLSFPSLELPEPVMGSFGSWRPFQLGFILLTLTGLVVEGDPSREEVDLLFFPTGGGKTEAYLGAAALTMFHRRLRDASHRGVDVLMRYTLRLLTIQQFERSAGLIAAMEHLRRDNPEKLGEAPFSIGVWLGDGTTPNKRQKAIDFLKKKGLPDSGANPFVLNKCPWCGAQFGYRKSNNSWLGYKQSESTPRTLRFECPDRKNCEFSTPSKALPIWITDEDVYDERPSFILATVDKFARLGWEPRARALFNRDDSGAQTGLPPSLIIQDELHLISGPLGSMVGLYEAVVEELCSYQSLNGKIGPKIIASTATTRRFQEQVLSLFGKEKTTIFPQAISRANETFFSSVAKENGQPVKGTAFVGLNPATYSTGQVSASQLAAILSQAPDSWKGSPDEIDFYTTAVWFFNSLKELGQTLTLMQSTVLSLIDAMWRDARLPKERSRSLEPMMELTGRISAAEVAGALERLGISASENKSVTTCLASSIMEVGVDVQRLGLLTIMGQPKMTSQYIQVAGRVGRARDKGPGLVVMLYNPSRARDRSIYEQFRSFHERLYSRVEPLSVTPFAFQTLEKGLEGALLSHYRMTTPISQSSLEPDVDSFDRSSKVLAERAAAIGVGEQVISDLNASVERFRKLWSAYKPAQWQYKWGQSDLSTDDLETALLRRSTKEMTHIPGDQSHLIPFSMRSVDNQTFLLPQSNVYDKEEEEDE